MIKLKLTKDKIIALEKITQVITEYVTDVRAILPGGNNMKRAELGAHLYILEELEFKLRRKANDLHFKNTPANKQITYELNSMQAFVLMQYNNIPPVKIMIYEYATLHEISNPVFKDLLT